MLRSSLFLPALLLIFGVAGTSSLSAQMNRQLERDATSGVLRIKPFESETCPGCEGSGTSTCGTCRGKGKKFGMRCAECRGKKKTTCRECFGHGKTQDSFKVAPCPRCHAHGVVPCFLCTGHGFLKNSDGSRGPKCRVCSKKGWFKCWVCGGRRSLALVQPKSGSFEEAGEAELKAFEARIKSLRSKVTAYLGTEQKPRKIYREEDYKTFMKALLKLLPEFRNDPKKVREFGRKALKHRNVREFEKLPGHARAASVAAAGRLLNHYQGILNAMKRVFEDQRKRKRGG